MKRMTILLLSVIASMSDTFAQTEDCNATLTRAQQEFNSGHFYLIPSVLDPCLNQFSSEQKQRAYLLLTESYLLLDDPIGAKQSYLQLLSANPEFVADTALHAIDVIYLSKRFTATSIISWFGKVGSNTSPVRVIQEQSTVSETNASSVYNLKAGYQLGGGVDFNYNDRFSARGELLFSVVSYAQESKAFFNADSKVFNGTQSWLMLPLTICYSDAKGKYRPYGYAGYQVQYLLGERANITIINNKPVASDINQRERTQEESPQLNFTSKRNRFNQSIVVGGGMKVKLGLYFLFADLRYNIGLRNIVSKANAYANFEEADLSSPSFTESMEPATRFMHVDDYFRMDNLSISVGFLRPLYKPRELRRARTRSVLKTIE